MNDCTAPTCQWYLWEHVQQHLEWGRGWGTVYGTNIYRVGLNGNINNESLQRLFSFDKFGDVLSFGQQPYKTAFTFFS